MRQSKISRLQRAVEGERKAQARFKEKVLVKESLSGDLIWKGEVYIFNLTYNSRPIATSKEKIAAWELAEPSLLAVEEAEARGQQIKENFQTYDEYKARSMKKAKLAYAWTFDFPGNAEERIYVAVRSGNIKTPADAVKSAYAEERE